MSSATETIKDRLGIVEVVSSYMKIDKAGTNYKGRCPFHHEKTPSFFVSPARNSYYCFGCGAKGDIFSFVQEFEKVDFLGSLKLLAERAGVELEQFRTNNGQKSESDRLYAVLEKSAEFYTANLLRNKKALEYLHGRGLSDKMISDWRIGYAENEWRKLHDMMGTKNVSDEDMEKVGLIKRSEKEVPGRSVSFYDRFRARIMFPLFDASSRVIGYSGRIFGVPDSEGPKYLNSPDTPLFNKSEILYGYHKAKEGIREWRYAILVEGQMDLLMCHQHGFTNTVATSGTSLTIQHLEKLKKISDNLMLVYDADKAGLKATLRAWTSALSLGMDVKVASLPAGEDPASLLLKDKEAFKQAIKHSKHIIDYYIDILLKENLPEIAFKRAVEKEVLPYIAVIDSAIERSNFISKVSLKTGIYESDIREQLEKISVNGIKGNNSNGASKFDENSTAKSHNLQAESGTYNLHISKTSTPYKGDIVLRRLVGLAIWKKDREIIEKIKHIVSLEEYERAKQDFDSPPEDLVFEAEMLFEGSKKIDKDIEELLQELEERTLKDTLSRAMADLNLAEKKKDKAKSEELIRLCQEISIKLSELNRKKQN